MRGTLAFFWRSRTPVGEAPFNIFRVGFADHSSWDMAFLRIDWNGHGFDAFVTDANLARTRVSFTIPRAPRPDEWHHIAFAWDETVGVRLYIDGCDALAALEGAVQVGLRLVPCPDGYALCDESGVPLAVGPRLVELGLQLIERYASQAEPTA